VSTGPSKGVSNEPGNGLSVGLDIGATKTLGLVVDGSGEIRARVREATEPGAEGVVRTAARVVEALRAATGEQLAGTVGVGMPGLVDVERGAVKHAVNLGVNGDWLPLGELLGERLGTPVVVENDVNVASLGAVAMTGEDDLVYLSIGTGLAAGLVLEGRLRRGDHGAAGEIGHVPVDPAGALCQCGQRGCLETVASGSALAAAWPSGDVPAAQALFAAADAGEPAAVAERDRFAAGVASAVRVLALSVDPRSVVLGGGVAQLGEPLRVAVAAALREQARTSPFLGSLDLAGRLRVVPTGYPVAAVGAALLGRS
jgi:glucokinase